MLDDQAERENEEPRSSLDLGWGYAYLATPLPFEAARSIPALATATHCLMAAMSRSADGDILFVSYNIVQCRQETKQTVLLNAMRVSGRGVYVITHPGDGFWNLGGGLEATRANNERRVKLCGGAGPNAVGGLAQLTRISYVEPTWGYSVLGLI